MIERGTRKREREREKKEVRGREESEGDNATVPLRTLNSTLVLDTCDRNNLQECQVNFKG
jgi:hypothetical protein